MNGRALGERIGWVVAATLLVYGTTSGPNDHAGSRPAGPPAAATSVAAMDASTTVSTARIGGTWRLPAWMTFDSAHALPGAREVWPSAPSVTPVTVVKPTPPKTATPKPPAPKPAAPKPAGVWWSVYHGTNHVWMPTLGINRPVYSFPCSRSQAPDNYVYRWGCAGTNNVYLLGHAWGVFKPLHDAYYNGKLRVGMPVIYADSRGHVHLYRVTTWRVVSPTDAAWAMASQQVPSMTLQTCVGSTGTLRLVVRLVQVYA